MDTKFYAVTNLGRAKLPLTEHTTHYALEWMNQNKHTVWGKSITRIDRVETLTIWKKCATSSD